MTVREYIENNAELKAEKEARVARFMELDPRENPDVSKTDEEYEMMKSLARDCIG